MVQNAGELSVYGKVFFRGVESGEFERVEFKTNAKLNLYENARLKSKVVQVSTGSVISFDHCSTIEWGLTEILGDGTLTADGASGTFGNMRISDGGLITHTALVTASGLTVTGDLTVDAGGALNVDGKGFGSVSGPGAGVGSQNGGGGGYGGAGGNGESAGGPAYGSPAEPAELGSGGGYGWYGSTMNVAGGTGGGSIRLDVGGTLTVNGAVSAKGTDGGAGNVYTAYWSGGGGSGGSIYLDVGTLAGSGTISVNGGNGGWANRAGGGGGGRIAMYFENYTYSGSVTVSGGAGAEYGKNGTGYSSPQVEVLQLNRQMVGQLQTPFSVKNWTFSAIAGQQVRLTNVSWSATGIVFDLAGPNGWVGFTGITAQSDLFTLPESGAYTLTVRGTGGTNNRSYSFMLQETAVTDLPLGSVYNGTFVGSGQAQLFRVNVEDGDPLRVALDDAALGNYNELYIKFGSPPTRGDYDYRFGNPAWADQQILVPMARPGVWYILVYGDKIVTPGSLPFIPDCRCFLYSVTPTRLNSAADATLTLAGAGFDSGTQVRLVNAGGEFRAMPRNRS